MPDPYVRLLESVDPAVLANEMFEHIQSYHPDWEVKSEAQLEAIIANAIANWHAELREQTSDVGAEIFAYLGESVYGIPRLDAVQALAEVTVTMVDDSGYTVSQGELVGIPVTGSEVQPFEVIADVVVAPGSTQATGVELRALNEGAAANEADGDPYLLGTLEYVSDLTLTTPPAGGRDAELVPDYLNRLVAYFSIPQRPVVAQDFADFVVAAIEGVGRAAAFDNYEPGDNEIQRIAAETPAPSAGTFTLTTTLPSPTVPATTSAIPWNGTAAQVQAALEGIGAGAGPIHPGDVIVTGGPLPATPIDVEFSGQYAETDVPQMTIGGGLLTGGTYAVSTTQAATGPTVVEKTVTVAVADTDGEELTDTIMTEADDFLQAQREANFVVHVVSPAHNLIDVTYSAVSYPGEDEAQVEADADAALTAYLSPATWGSRRSEVQAVPTDWANTPFVRRRELEAVLNDVPGLDYVTALTFRKAGGTLADTDVEMAGIAPLPRAGTLSGTVTAPS